MRKRHIYLHPTRHPLTRASPSLTPTLGLLLLATDRYHGLRPDKLPLLLVQFGTGIVYKDRHDVLWALVVTWAVSSSGVVMWFLTGLDKDRTRKEEDGRVLGRERKVMRLNRKK